MKLEKLNQEIQEYKDMILKDHKKAYQQYGFTLLYNLDYETFVEHLKALGFKPTTSLDFYNLGVVYVKKGKLDDALKMFHEAVKIDKNFKDAYYNMACIYEEKNQKKKALDLWNNYLKLDSDSEWAKEAKEAVKPF